MYERRFGLEKNPFRMTPDPSFLFFTEMHREALSGLVYSVMENKGFVVLTGDAGVGKTTLLSQLIRHVPEDRVSFSLVLNPTLTPNEFLEAALLDFGIQSIPESKVQRLLLLQRFIADARAEGRNCVLVVDEAQKLSPEVLEEIRLLTNFETAEQKLLQIILVGQNELRDTLARPDLRQLRQRIAARFELRALVGSEVDDYVHFRWASAGGSAPLPFSARALARITRASSGIPRLINAICDNALLLAFAMETESVTDDQLSEVLTDLDLNRPSPVERLSAVADHLASVERSKAPPKEFPRQIENPRRLDGLPNGGLTTVSRRVSEIKLEIPKPLPGASPVLPIRLSTLERYAAERTTVLGRMAEKFGF